MFTVDLSTVDTIGDVVEGHQRGGWAGRRERPRVAVRHRHLGGAGRRRGVDYRPFQRGDCVGAGSAGADAQLLTIEGRAPDGTGDATDAGGGGSPRGRGSIWKADSSSPTGRSARPSTSPRRRRFRTSSTPSTTRA